MDNGLVVARNHNFRRIANRNLVVILSLAMAASVGGCFALSPELQRESDKLALELNAKKKELKQVYADIKDGKLNTAEGLALVKKLTADLDDLNTRLDEIAASTGVSKAKVAGVVAINLLLLAFGGKQFLVYKNAVVRVVRAIHSVRENKGTVENLVGCVKSIGNKALDKAAAQMPKLKKKNKP